jgi:ABC-2 type transport system ATP-binding protein
MLTFRGVSAGYRRRLRRQPAVAELYLRIRPGEVTALVGPNGAGKTTVLRLALGSLRPWTGRVERPAPGGARSGYRIGHLPEQLELPRRPTLRRFLRYGTFLAGLPPSLRDDAVRAAARDTDLTDALDREMGELSSGMGRRAALAFTLLARPPVLLLDEPWRGIDPASRATLRRVVRAEARRGVLVVVSSHELADVARVAQRVLVLAAGRVRADLRAPLDAERLEDVLLERARAG